MGRVVISAPRYPRIASVAVALCISAGLANPASARLGASSASVEVDRAHMSAHHVAEARGAFMVHTLSESDGSEVREFARADGMIFAVTWVGPARPDLRQALGPYFDELNAANPPRSGGGRHRPLIADRADLMVRSGGHSGAFWGIAIVPALLPPGVSPTELH